MKKKEEKEWINQYMCIYIIHIYFECANKIVLHGKLKRFGSYMYNRTNLIQNDYFHIILRVFLCSLKKLRVIDDDCFWFATTSISACLT